MITREYLETKIQELTVARDRQQRDMYANNGAIQFCQHLLAELAAAAKAEDEKAEAVTVAVAEAETAKANGEYPDSPEPVP